MIDEADDRRQPLNAGSRGMARDPALIYEQTEGRYCVGCVHEHSVAIAGGEVTRYCAIGQKRYPNRCRRYVEREPERVSR